jgi:hypothetical protein
MRSRFSKKAKVFDIGVTAVAAVLSVGIMIYGVFHFGLSNTWPELVLNIFYIACLVMMWMYFFNIRITTQQFNYWSSVCVGITILLRDILFAPPLVYYSLHVVCSTLSVILVLMLTFFYARKEWKTYSKSNLWMIFIVDCIIALLYNWDIYLEPRDEFTDYMLTEIWIRPTITYGLVACFVTEQEVSD